MNEEQVESKALTEDEKVVLQELNFRYQRAYGNASLLWVSSWLVLLGLDLYFIGLSWGAFALIVGSALLCLFALRATVHIKGRAIKSDFDSFLVGSDYGIEELIEVLRQDGAFHFLLSLIDGPMARQARQRAGARAQESK